MGPDEGNPKGRFEPMEAVHFNDAFLYRQGATWWEPTLRLQGEIAFDDQEREVFTEQIRDFLEACPKEPLLVIKENRVVTLSDFWFEAARRAGFAVKIVIPVRHPEAVAASWATRAGLSYELSSALWIKYNLLAERQSRHFPRVFVEYSELLNDWRKQTTRVAEALSIEWSGPDEAAINAFLTQDLYRNRHSGTPAELFGQPWTGQIYTALSAACHDAPLDFHTMDEIFWAFSACERTFRIAFDEFRTRWGPPPTAFATR
jgi:hypothetical protein